MKYNREKLIILTKEIAFWTAVSCIPVLGGVIFTSRMLKDRKFYDNVIERINWMKEFTKNEKR